MITKMSGLVRLMYNRFSKKVIPMPSQFIHSRFISTSKKNRDTLDVTVDTESKCLPAFSESKNNWISYGFSHKDRREDRIYMHLWFFFGITVSIVFGTFVYAYQPDQLGRDWALREGFLELRRREAEGLPLVDPNYLPESEIVLPSDEELGDTEIII